MRAVVLHEYGGPEKLKLEEFDDPQVSGDTVLIATAAASVNPVDWKMRSGEAKERFPVQFPAVLGRDVSGVVRAVGANVNHFKPGDRVMAFAKATYAELVAVDANIVTHIPDGVDVTDAAAIPLAALTGDQLVRRATMAQKDQTILVMGALGSVGRAAVHTAKKIGAKVIAGVRKKDIDAARALGVTAVIAIDDDDAIAKLGTIDGIADTVGGETATRLIGKVKPGGNYGTVVTPRVDGMLHPMVKVNHIMAQPEPAKVREFADDIRDGKFVLPIGRRMPMGDAGEAQRLGEKGGVGKIILLAIDPKDS